MSLPLPGDQMELGFGQAPSPVVVAVATARERHQSAVRWLLGVMRVGVPADGAWLVTAADRRGITAAEIHAAFEELLERGAIEKQLEPVMTHGVRAYMPTLRIVPFRRRNASPTETYRVAKSRTGSQAAACRAVMAAHGIDADGAAELCWHVETGGPAPQWLHEDGSPTAASRAWDRGAERRGVDTE